MKRIQETCGTASCTSIHLTGVPGREKRKEKKKLFEEIMAKNSPDLRKRANLHVQEAQ